MTPDVRVALSSMHLELKETLRMQVALEQILKNRNACKGEHILADVVKNKLATMDMCLMFIEDLLRENSSESCIKCNSKDHEIIDADAVQAEAEQTARVV